MEQEIIELIKSKTGRSENDVINWRVCEHGSLVESLPFMEVVKIFVEFINDCFEYLKEEEKTSENKNKLMYSAFKVLGCHFVI